MIGSTDSHTSLATAEEDNFFGKHSGAEPKRRSRDPSLHAVARTARQRSSAGSMTASGYAGVWATDNTREAIFDALMRKEVYATTGPRMIVRFFGGWDFTPEDAAHPQSRRGRLRQGRADGRRPQRRARGQGRRPSSSLR